MAAALFAYSEGILKKIFELFVAFCVLFCGCASSDPQIDPNNYIIKVTSYDEKSITYAVINNSKNTVEIGEAFYLEYKEGENWIPIEEKEETFFNMIAYVIEPGEVKTFDGNTEIRYGVLQEGTYRIVKDIWIWNEDGTICGEQKTFGEFETN